MDAQTHWKGSSFSKFTLELEVRALPSPFADQTKHCRQGENENVMSSALEEVRH